MPISRAALYKKAFQDQSKSSEVDAFLKEIKSVCIKHGFSISHEDVANDFEIIEYDESKMNSLLSAVNCVGR
ncbi:MAG: hypothetical protein GW763_09000 [Paraglaciecola sp.]|nr:hypothetical protein [Paraglaciecola sp.]NCT48108.1 hypothetical protein [Paraglaciecola sp.]